MAITLRASKSTPLTYEEMDGNFQDLDKRVYSTTTDPTVTDDASAGFDVGYQWTNKTTGLTYKLTDSTVGAAVWKENANTTSSPLVKALGFKETRVDFSVNMATGSLNVPADCLGDYMVELFVEMGDKEGFMYKKVSYHNGGLSYTLEEFNTSSWSSLGSAYPSYTSDSISFAGSSAVTLTGYAVFTYYPLFGTVQYDDGYGNYIYYDEPNSQFIDGDGNLVYTVDGYGNLINTSSSDVGYDLDGYGNIVDAYASIIYAPVV